MTEMTQYSVISFLMTLVQAISLRFLQLALQF